MKSNTNLPLSVTEVFAASDKALGAELKGKINHSVCKWCYSKIPLETFAQECQKIGLKSIELLGPEEWPVLKKYGLTCALPNGAGMGIEKGFNDPKNHDALVKSYEEIFPKIQAAGYTSVICFSGNRNGMSDIDGMRNCAEGLKRLIPSAEKYNVTLIMELLNSKVNHRDYMCDHTTWGAGLCEMIGSEKFKLLYDIYHMQIMEGDVIATIKKYHKYIGHYHTGGVPGRNEIDETQELYYPAIMKAIVDTGFKGFVAQEFIPSRKDDIASLKQGVTICDIA
ncbi:hydroxypyruvate isomerase family protein [Dyadobacter frigoris]|uniref:TIM barrel protein n=1 Tax=Dyadobacter frigoris TaxID=2576211 RepID=A0A4U6D4C9_9BACT|nr:TIM barrel protein [Dyadobacter frigoris]TKT88824.1 TIM barrel protein [Dyadobacter frigoris]GLU56012.1 hydroxypyruvate isomerase [Dyadobacter frigoris]